MQHRRFLRLNHHQHVQHGAVRSRQRRRVGPRDHLGCWKADRRPHNFHNFLGKSRQPVNFVTSLSVQTHRDKLPQYFTIQRGSTRIHDTFCHSERTFSRKNPSTTHSANICIVRAIVTKPTSRRESATIRQRHEPIHMRAETHPIMNDRHLHTST